MRSGTEVWSFLWLSVDAAGQLTGPQRVYSESIPEVLRARAETSFISPDQHQRLDLAEAAVASLNAVLTRISHRNYLLESSRLLAGEEHAQLTLLQCGQHGQNNDEGWARFERDAKQLVPGLDLGPLVQRRQDLAETGSPAAYTIREFEGIMPDVETVHLAFAAALFHFCGLRLSQPVWTRTSD